MCIVGGDCDGGERNVMVVLIKKLGVAMVVSGQREMLISKGINVNVSSPLTPLRDKPLEG